MASKRETAIVALVDAIKEGLASRGTAVFRGTDLPELIPAGGAIKVEEGDAQTETILSPLTYAVTQGVTLTVAVAAGDEADRDPAMDDLLTALSDVLTTDRTLGGAVDWLEVGTPEFAVYEGDGAVKDATLSLALEFDTPDSPIT